MDLDFITLMKIFDSKFRLCQKNLQKFESKVAKLGKLIKYIDILPIEYNSEIKMSPISQRQSNVTYTGGKNFPEKVVKCEKKADSAILEYSFDDHTFKNKLHISENEFVKQHLERSIL